MDVRQLVAGRKNFELAGETSGAKGTRTPDPHTASVVRYQLRHSPKKLCPSKLHHRHPAFKVAGQAGSSAARVSGAGTQATAAISRTIPLMAKAQP
jgi:hypothetical protein